MRGWAQARNHWAASHASRASPTCLPPPPRPAPPRPAPQVSGCCHDLCFGCARRLCAQQDHQVPQCPFCRQAIEGFSPLAVPRCAASASASAASARAAVRA